MVARRLSKPGGCAPTPREPGLGNDTETRGLAHVLLEVDETWSKANWRREYVTLFIFKNAFL